MTITLSSSDIAGGMGVSKRAVTNWVKDGGLEVHRRGDSNTENTFELKAFVKWWADREIASRVVTTDGNDYDRSEEEARLKHHQANLEEIKEAEKRGELIPLSDAISEFGELAANARAKMLAISKDAPDDYKKRLDEQIRGALDELSKSEAAIQE